MPRFFFCKRVNICSKTIDFYTGYLTIYNLVRGPFCCHLTREKYWAEMSEIVTLSYQPRETELPNPYGRNLSVPIKFTGMFVICLKYFNHITTCNFQKKKNLFLIFIKYMFSPPLPPPSAFRSTLHSSVLSLSPRT